MIGIKLIFKGKEYHIQEDKVWIDINGKDYNNKFHISVFGSNSLFESLEWICKEMEEGDKVEVKFTTDIIKSDPPITKKELTDEKKILKEYYELKEKLKTKGII